MNNTIIFILAFIDTLSELIHLTFQLGQLTRKVAVPTIAYIYVCGEYVWDKLTSYDYHLKVYNTPLTTGLC